jgi:hypothetical protein
MKTILKTILAISLFILLARTNTFAQGCVAIRSTGGICTMNEHPDSANSSAYWLVNSNNRYYRSFRHFIGKQEQTERTEQHTNVINKVYQQDITLTRVFNSRWSMSFDLPISDNSRSQLAGTTRFSTHSFGLGDMNITGAYWLFNPVKAKKGNVQVGMGIKFASGNNNVQDYFLTNPATGERTLKLVDQSIQLGDGGTGIITEINAYYNFTPKFGFYGNFYYLLNPQDVSIPKSATTAPATSNASPYTADVFSVPDQMLVRFGAGLAVKKFDFSLGVRYDELPVYDLVGGVDGYRRPGYIIAAEPGINYRINNVGLYFYCPIAIIRDRTQSVADRRATEAAASTTGKVTHGDAAFADYVINIGVTVKF